jgi:hypothetical protein
MTTIDPVMDRRIREELNRRVKAGAVDPTLVERLTRELDRRSPNRPDPAETALATMGRMAARTPRSQPAPASAPVAANGVPQAGSELDMSGLQMTPQLLRNTDAGSVIERNVQDAGRGFVRGVPTMVRQFAGAAEAVESAVIPQTPSTPGLFREMREQLLDPADKALPPTQEFAGGVVESLPAVGASFLAGPAAPLVAAAQSGGAQFNDARERMEGQGATYDQATQIARAEAAPMAVFTGLTSLPVFGELANRGIPAETAKSWIVKAVPQPVQRIARMMGIPLGEATQEASEEVVSMAMQQWAEADPAAFNDWQGRVLQAATAGGLIGTGAHILTRGTIQEQQQGTGASPEPMGPPGGADNAGAAVSPQPSEDPNQDAAPRAAAGAAPVPAATSSTTTGEDPFAVVEALQQRLSQVMASTASAETPAQSEPTGDSTAPEAQAEALPQDPPEAARRDPGAPSFLRPTREDSSRSSPNVSGRPQLGSQGLNIPMDVVPPEARRAEAKRRAGVRDATNRILNPPQRGYSTEGSLTPGDVFPPRTPAPGDESFQDRSASDRPGPPRTADSLAQEPPRGAPSGSTGPSALQEPRPGQQARGATPARGDTGDGRTSSTRSEEDRAGPGSTSAERNAGRVGPPPGDAAEPKPKPAADYSDLEVLTDARDEEPGTERERATEQIRASFGDEATAVLPIMDAYAKSWASATGKSTDVFYGRFTFEKGGSDAGSMKQADGLSKPGAQGGPFYSAAEKAARTFKDPKAKMTGAQWHKWLQNAPGIKPEELEWIGLDQVAEKMTPAEAADWIAGHGVKVEEVTLGAPLPPSGWKAEKQDDGSYYIRKPDGTYHSHVSGQPWSWSSEAGANAAIKAKDETNAEGREPTKFENFQTPGGTGYRELLLTMPAKPEQLSPKEDGPAGWSSTRSPTEDTANFRGGHFDQPNILAHVRYNERTDADGKKVLFLEEIQSDWHQRGKKDGYASPKNAADYTAKTTGWTRSDGGPQLYGIFDKNGEEAGSEMATSEEEAITKWIANMNRSSRQVPDAPFKTSWPMLAMKRMMVYAAQNGFDRIAWTTGEMQAERYDLSKQVDRILYAKDGDKYRIRIFKGENTLDDRALSAEDLPDFIGKEMARKIIEGEGKPSPRALFGSATRPLDGRSLEGLDLKVGGEGMAGFYDQILPAETNKIAKKWGGRVGTTNIQAGKVVHSGKEHDGPPMSVHSLDVTPAMRDAVAGGMPLFQGTPQDARGSYRMLEDGRVVIRALTDPNASTLPHEVAHAFLDFLDEVDPELKTKASEALGAKKGQKPTVEHHERWARAFEKYLRDGIAPSSVLRQAFEQFRTWLRNIYQAIKGSPLEGKLSPAIKRIFDDMLTRGESAAPGAKTAGKPSPAKKAPANQWSKAGLGRMLRQAYDQSPAGAVAAGRMEMGEQETGAATHSMSKFKRGIPQDLKESLEGRDDLLDMLTANAGGDANGEDFLGQMGVAGYIDYLEGLAGGGSLKNMAQEIRDAGGDPQAELVADLWESTPAGRPTPKDTIEIATGDELPVGSRFTIDGRAASVVSRGGEPTLKIKGLGEYPLIALREIPADRGSVEMFQRDGSETPAATSSKIVDLATYIAIRAAKVSPKNAKVTIPNVRSALDTYTGHGKYTETEVRQVAAMATSLLRRSRNEYRTVDPARLEANTARAYARVQKAQRAASRPSRLQKALDAATGVRAAPSTQEAVDRAVALERGQAAIGRAMEVRAAERAGEERAARLTARLSEQGRKSRDEMAQERRQMRDRLIGSIEALKHRALREGYLQAQQAGEAGAKEATERLQAFRDEAARIILKNLPRGERGRATLVRALRTAQSVKDIQRLITEVQHRAVSSRAGLAWKELRRDLKGNTLKTVPEAAKDIPGLEEGKNYREHVRRLLTEATALIRVARNQKAAPMKLARLLALRRQWLPIFSSKTTSPEVKARAREILTKVREQLKEIRPDLAPKVEAAARLKEIQGEVHTLLHTIKHADRVYLANERKSARQVRQFAIGRISSTNALARQGVQSKPGLNEDPSQGWVMRSAFESMTPDTFGQWLDNAAGFPEKAGFSRTLLFEAPLDAAAAIAEEKVKRLEQLNALAKKHGLADFNEARAKISGTLGPGLQETVDIDVDGWGPTKLTMGEALKIMGDHQDVQTSELSDMGMRHQLDRLRSKPETTLDRADRERIIEAIPKNYRDFYTEMKQLKDEVLGGRTLEVRRRLKGTAPDKVENREPRIRETDSDYSTDIFNQGGATRSSLLERSFMKDRVHNPGPTNIVVDGLDTHLKDWDDQLHTIHHAELSNAIAKTLLHPTVQREIVRKAGEEAWERLNKLVDRILGIEIRPKPNVVDSAVAMLKKNTGAGLTAVSPRTFVKQFAVIPLLAGMHPTDVLPAMRGLLQKGLRERMMKANGLLAQRLSMTDAAIIASKGTSNPIIDMGDVRLKRRASGRDFADAYAQLIRGEVRNAASSAISGLGNARDALTNSLRANSWADEQGVRLCFLIAERQVDREHPNLNKADRERLIGRKAAQMVHRYMNTYDTLGQAFWRGDLDAGRIGSIFNMFSNDSTKQINMALQAAWSGDRNLRARTTAALAMSKTYSALAPASMVAAGLALTAALFGSSDDDEDRWEKYLKEAGSAGIQEFLGLTPGPAGEMVESLGQMAFKGIGGVEVGGSPAIDMLTSTVEASYRTVQQAVKAMAPPDPEASPLQNYNRARDASENAWKSFSAAARTGGTLAGVGVMPVVNFLRAMAPAREPIGMAAYHIREKDTKAAKKLLAEEYRLMIQFGVEPEDAEKSLKARLGAKLNRRTDKANEDARNALKDVAEELVEAVVNP